MSDFIRGVIDASLPEGSAWRVAPDQDLDKFHDGSAENSEVVRLFLEDLANVRNPQTTIYLEELEREFGVFTNPMLTEQQRRDTLTPLVFERGGNGSKDILQNALVSAGFDVEVYQNSPAQDPAPYIESLFQMYAAGGNAFAGRPDAFAGFVGGELLVNGDVFENQKIFTAVAGSGSAFAGTMTAGEFSGFERREVPVGIPTNPNSFPMIFFVGAPGGFISPDFDIDQAEIPLEQRDVFRTLILKIKPLHSWAVLVVTYV